MKFNVKSLENIKLANIRNKQCPHCLKMYTPGSIQIHINSCKDNQENYSLYENICECCNNKFELKIYKNIKPRFCSKKCSRSFATKSKRGEINKQVSDSLKLYHFKNGTRRIKYNCIKCSKEMKIRGKYQLCKGCLNKHEEYRDNLRKATNKRIKQGNHKGWISRNIISYPEQYFIKVFDDLGIKYKHNYAISKKKLGINESSSYFLDFYFEDINICIEIDGKQHKYSNIIEYDKIRDKRLIDYGIKIIRIQWFNPINEQNKKKLYDQIDKVKEILRSMV